MFSVGGRELLEYASWGGGCYDEKGIVYAVGGRYLLGCEIRWEGAGI